MSVLVCYLFAVHVEDLVGLGAVLPGTARVHLTEVIAVWVGAAMGKHIRLKGAAMLQDKTRDKTLIQTRTA